MKVGAWRQHQQVLYEVIYLYLHTRSKGVKRKFVNHTAGIIRLSQIEESLNLSNTWSHVYQESKKEVMLPCRLIQLNQIYIKDHIIR